MAITIRTIAEMANVSCTTVSRVLNNKSDVNSETRKKILALVANSGFQPNSFARSIHSKKSHCVGVIIPHKMSFILSENFYNQIILGLSDGLLERNYYLLFCNTEHIEDLVNIYRQRRADGFVFVRLGEDDLKLVDTLNSMNIPFVSTSNLSNAKNLIHVDIDNYAAGCQAVEYLISLGHKKIGMIVESNTLSCSKERYLAYINTMKKYDYFINEKNIRYADPNMLGGYAAMKEVLQNGEEVSAFFVDGDALAIGAMKAIRENNKKVPEDISIIGFDGIGSSEYSDPPLTTIQQPVYQKAVLAAKLLIDKLENKKNVVSVDLEAKIVIRASTKSIKNSHQKSNILREGLNE